MGWRGVACGCSIVSVLIVIIALIIASISVLDPNEVGLAWNGVTMTLHTDKVYESGTYFLGVNQAFIKFPKTQITIKYANTAGDDGDPISCRTLDGLPITISFAFNYRIRTTAEELAYLYINFGDIDNIDLAYQRTARNVVRVIASRYPAFSFFFDRASIQADLLSKMSTELSTLGANVESLQLLDVSFPTAFNDARTRQESAAQQVVQANNELQVASINTDTKVQRARQEAALIITNANAVSEGALFRNDAAEKKFNCSI